jgi:branched-chain amino acid transport system permease protein
VERIAYRPLRGSFRLAPLISAIGMSIALQNYVQLVQGARPRAMQPVATEAAASIVERGGSFNMSFVLMTRGDGFTVVVNYLQIFIIAVTVVLMTIFTLIITRTALGRAQRACEQDKTMAALLGVNVDRTISITFVMGAALAAVAGLMAVLYYGAIDFYDGFIIGVKAFTAAVLGGIGSLPGAMLGGFLIGLTEAFWSAYVSVEYKDVAVFSILVMVLIFRPTGLLGKPQIEKV